MLPGGQPYVQYSSPSAPGYLAQYILEQVLGLATAAQWQQACLDATELADSHIRGRYTLPVVAVGNDVMSRTAAIVYYLVMDRIIGFAAMAGSDRNVRRGYAEAMGGPDPDNPGFIHPGWFPGIQTQRIHPDITVSPPEPGDPIHDIPQVLTTPPRGWTNRHARSQRSG